MKKMLTVFTLVLAAMVANGQKTIEEVIFADAEAFNQSMLAADYDKYVDYLIEEFVEVSGGRELAKQSAEELFGMYKESGMEYVKLTPLKVEKVVETKDKQLQTILTQELVFKIAGSEFSKKAYFLAVSTNEGGSWKFLDLESHNEESVKMFVPSFSSKLVIPVSESGMEVQK